MIGEGWMEIALIRIDHIQLTPLLLFITASHPDKSRYQSMDLAVLGILGLMEIC